MVSFPTVYYSNKYHDDFVVLYYSNNVIIGDDMITLSIIYSSKYHDDNDKIIDQCGDCLLQGQGPNIC